MHAPHPNGYLTTLNLSFAGVGSAFGAASIARTLNLCLLSSRCLTFLGDAQDLKGLLSSLHSKVSRALRK